MSFEVNRVYGALRDMCPMRDTQLNNRLYRRTRSLDDVDTMADEILEYRVSDRLMIIFLRAELQQ